MDNEFRLSVSKTKVFSTCKKQYHFSYILKFPKKERDYHILGTFAHKVLENFHNLYISDDSIPFNKGMSKSFKEAQLEYGNKITPEIKKECFSIIDNYLKIIYTNKEHPLSTKVIGCEKSFSIKIKQNIILNGFIDRIQLDSDGTLHVADYKTTKNPKYLKNDFFQLLTYCYALLLEDPSLEKIRASYILLRHNFEYVTKEFLREDILKIKDQYLDYADKMMKETEFEAKPTILCGYCDFIESCPEGLSMVNSKNKTQINGEIDW